MSTRKKGALTGKVLGKYELGLLLGKGAFGEVYLAHALENREWVRAVKVLAVGQREYEDAKRRFKLEASLCRDRIHPNVILVHEPPQEEGGYLYLVMEYADGGSLRDLITKAQQEGKPIAVEEVRRIAIQLVAGLKAIHGHPAKLVHRDICPENILLKGRNKQVVISDLGVAQTRDNFTRRTQLGSLAPPHPGHPTYMSPQQRNDRAPVKPGDDLFSVGCVLFELLTLKPYQGAEVELDSHPGKYRKGIPQWLDEVVARCLAPERRDRFQVAEDLLASLEQGRVIRRTAEEVLRSRPISHPPRHPMRPVVEPPKREAAASKARRRKGWFALVGLLLLLVSVVGGVAMGALGWGRLQGAPAAPALTSPLPPTFTRAPSLAMTRTPVPTLTITPTSTSTLATIPVFTPTFTSTSFAWPVRMGTPYPVPDVPITTANTEQVVQLAQWGKGPNQNYTMRVNSVDFSPNRLYVAAGEWDEYSYKNGMVQIWQLSDGNLIDSFQENTSTAGRVSAVSFSPNGQLLAVAHEGNGGGAALTLWDVNGAVYTQRYSINAHLWSVNDVAFSPDSAWLASAGGDKVIRVWDVNTGKVIEELKGHTREVTSVAFSPDGKLLASAANDGTVRLWRAAGGRLLRTQHHKPPDQGGGVHCVAFSPDGQFLASGGGDLRLWRVSDGLLLHVFEEGANSVSFSPDGSLLAAASGNEIALWDLSNYRRIAVLKGHTGEVMDVTFSPDGTLLASGSDDGTIRLWGVKP